MSRPRIPRPLGTEPLPWRDAVTVVLLAGVVAALHRLGDGVLAAPPSWDLDGIRDWLTRPDPITTALGAVRLGVLALAWYSLVVGLLSLGAGLSGRADARALARRLTLPPLRRTVVTVSGLALSTAGIAAGGPVIAGAGGPAEGPGQVPGALLTVERIDEQAPLAHEAVLGAPDRAARPGRAPTARSDDPAGVEGPSGTATMRGTEGPEAWEAAGEQTVDPGPDAAEADPPAEDRPDPPSEPASEAGADAADRGTDGPSGGDTWEVRSGDNLWRIAETTLRDRVGPEATDGEVAAYWERVIEANQDVLIDPDSPDLILVGQRIHLPPVA